jgi:hypothetical protein
MGQGDRSSQGKVNPVQVQKYLKGVDYPLSKQDLVKRAQEEGADQQLVKTLERIPGEEFKSPADISQAIGRLE